LSAYHAALLLLSVKNGERRRAGKRVGGGGTTESGDCSTALPLLSGAVQRKCKNKLHEFGGKEEAKPDEELFFSSVEFEMGSHATLRGSTTATDRHGARTIERAESCEAARKSGRLQQEKRERRTATTTTSTTS
jgi:hypothetical protein